MIKYLIIKFKEENNNATNFTSPYFDFVPNYLADKAYLEKSEF